MGGKCLKNKWGSNKILKPPIARCLTDVDMKKELIYTFFNFNNSNKIVCYILCIVYNESERF